MIERIGDIVEIGGETIAPGGSTVIALHGIIAIVDSTAEKPGQSGLFAQFEPCTAIVIEGGQQINVSREDGAAIRRHLKDYAREQAAQRSFQ